MSFSTASASALAIVRNQTGGPWNLISVVGIGSTSSGWPDLPSVANTEPCQNLPGPSIWNATSLSTTSVGLEFGVLPFWSLWFTNSTHYLTSVGIENRTDVTADTVAPSSPCGVALTAGKVDLSSAAPIAPADSIPAAQIGWQDAGHLFVEGHAVTVGYFTYGVIQIDDMAFGSDWGMTYTVCGAPGFGGVGAYSFVGLSSSGSPPSVFINGASTCSLANYSLSFAHPIVTSPSTQPGAASFTMAVNAFVGSGTITDAAGLGTWLMGLNLTNQSTGTAIPASTVSCNGQRNLSQCTDASNGWFAILATSSGWGLDIFADFGGTLTWMLPNVPAYSNDTLIVHFPANPANYSLALRVVPTTASIPVSGMVTW